MIRSIQIAAVALAALASPALSHAQPAAVSVPYKASEMATTEGRAAVKSRAAVKAEEVCRSMPYGSSDNCRKIVAKQMNDQIDASARQYAAKRGLQLSTR
jgi:UrcA family protein